MDALEAFCDHLDMCIAEKKDPHPSPLLWEAFGLQFALALSGDQADSPLGPPLREYPTPNTPDAFAPLIYTKDGNGVIYFSQDIACGLSLSSGASFDPATADYAETPADGVSPDSAFYTDRHDFVGVYASETKALVKRLSWERSSSEACAVNVAFSPDTKLVAVSYAYDNAIRLWNIQSDDQPREFIASDHEAALAFSPDGELLLAGTKGGTTLFHIASGYRIYANRFRQTYCVGFRPSGTEVITDTSGPALNVVDLSALVNREKADTLAIIEYIQQHETLFTSQPGSYSDWERLYHLSMSF